MSFTNTFRSFKSRNYSLFFFGQLISRVGTWMQRMAVIWVVYTMTHSVFMIGLTTFAEQFPSFLLSPAGGIAADRHNKQKLVLITQILAALQATALAIVYLTGYHQVWLILSLSVVLGIANAFEVPARQSMVNDLIDNKEDLPNAIAINSSLNNLSRLLGPALSGFVLARYGAGVCFASNAISFIAVIASLMMMKVPQQLAATVKKKIAADFKEGLNYVKRHHEIGNTVLLLALTCLLVNTYNTLIPVYAKEIFNGNAATYGYLSAFIGLGAVISTLSIASRKPGHNMKKVLRINIIVVGFALIAFSYTHLFPVNLLLATVAGFGTMSVIPICNTIIQLASSPEMRGRAVSFFTMAAFGTIPIGSLLVGWLSNYIGPQNCILAQGIIALVIAGCFSKFLSGNMETAKIESSGIKTKNTKQYLHETTNSTVGNGHAAGHLAELPQHRQGSGNN
ncbi:MFS transporter [Niastella koreensis]|uniref:Major facilitator superfamily MFS_1 n=2 Tax=Niastella koreensis TaxID=354356 RepID=G8TR83_NIAKG|nr:MFS transporter [Niastella koreensis]AEW00005.1 major facilitator superfamily MFS_1 [Niastella koreensis GR20-10]OQP51395.1 MFS transporter [Niastella koreensis]